jgi:hypothetical protein
MFALFHAIKTDVKQGGSSCSKLNHSAASREGLVLCDAV